MNMQAMLRQAQQMQKDMLKAKDEIDNTEFTGESSFVKVTVKGTKEVVSVDIDAESLDSDDIEALQDMIVVAINQANKKVDDMTEKKMGKLEADTYSQSNESARLTAAADNLNYMESPSVVLGKVKKKIFNFQVDNSFLMPFEAVYGYMRGFASSCVDKAIPLTMGLFALIGGKVTSKLSAFGLMLYAGYKVLHEGFGIGKVNRLEQPYK